MLENNQIELKKSLDLHTLKIYKKEREKSYNLNIFY